jgi:hypothetical protein
MKNLKALLSFPLFAGMLILSSFSPKQDAPKQEIASAAIQNLAWYTPAGVFVAWSTVANAEIVSGDDTNPVGGTLALLGYTNGGFGITPTGSPVSLLYSHP